MCTGGMVLQIIVHCKLEYCCLRPDAADTLINILECKDEFENWTKEGRAQARL